MSRYTPKMLLIAAAAVTAGAFATLPASAQDAPPPPPAPEAGKPAPKPERPLNIRAQIMFNLVDINGDGGIDQTEMMALQKAIFTAIDTDKDGKLTQAEFKNLMAGGGDRGPRAGRGGPEGGPGWHRHGPRGPEAGPRGHRGGEFRNQRGGPRGEDFRGPRGQGRHGNLDQQMMPGQNPDGARQVGSVDRNDTAPQNFASLDANSDGTVTPDEFAKGAPVLPFVPQ